MVTPTNQNEIDEAEWYNSANWKWGLFYYSLRDSRSWVPKRSMLGRRRFGGTPNFAKKAARLYVTVILGFMVLLFLIVAALERTGILR